MEYAGWELALGIVAVYTLITVALGYVAFRRLEINVEDYFLVSRAAGFLILYFTIVATYHSAFALLTSSGVFYRDGIYFWAAGGWTFLTGILTYVFGVRFWYLGKKYGYITPSDLIADYYKSDFLRGLVAIVMAIFLIPYMTVQAMGLGYITNVASAGRISVETGILFFMLIVCLYVIAGGLRAVYWTDFVQGIWMFLALWMGGLALVFALWDGPGGLFAELAKVKPAQLTVKEALLPMWFSNTIIFSFGIVLQPHMWMRYYTAKDPKILKWLGATTPIYLMFIYVPAALIGFSAALAVTKGLMPDIVKTFGTVDAVMPAMMTKFMPAWFAGILLAGGVAAAMSTADSQLHAFSAVLTRDVYAAFIKRDASHMHLINLGRILMALAFILSSLLALTKPGVIFDIVAFAGAGSLQLLPAVVATIYRLPVRVTKEGAISGIVVGGILVFLLTKGLGDKFLGIPVGFTNPWGFHGGIIALVVNLIVTVIVSLFTKLPPESEEKFHGYLRQTEIYQ